MPCKILQFPKPYCAAPVVIQDDHWKILRAILADVLDDSHPEMSAAIRKADAK